MNRWWPARALLRVAVAASTGEIAQESRESVMAFQYSLLLQPGSGAAIALDLTGYEFAQSWAAISERGLTPLLVRIVPSTAQSQFDALLQGALTSAAFPTGTLEVRSDSGALVHSMSLTGDAQRRRLSRRSSSRNDTKPDPVVS